MSVNDQSAASRQFVASSPAFSSKWTVKRSYIFVYGGLAAIIGSLFVVHATVGWNTRAMVAVPVLFVSAGLGVIGYFWWQSRRKIVIGVTSDGLTVNARPGDVFSLVDAELGPWVTMGVALHLHCGRHRFLLGGRDRRIAPATRLDARPVMAVDAWLSGSDFDEVLSMSGRRIGLDGRGPAPGEPTRCLLFTNPLSAGQVSSFAIGKQRRLRRSVTQPQLAIDVDNDAIRVIDPNSNTVNASASLAQVTATPAIYGPEYRHVVPTPKNVAIDAEVNYTNRVPGLIVSIPGLQRLTIGCRDFIGLRRRFSWHGKLHRVYEHAAYAVSGADLLTLVETFGLASHLEDSMNKAGQR